MSYSFRRTDRGEIENKEDMLECLSNQLHGDYYYRDALKSNMQNYPSANAVSQNRDRYRDMSTFIPSKEEAETLIGYREKLIEQHAESILKLRDEILSMKFNLALDEAKEKMSRRLMN